MLSVGCESEEKEIMAINEETRMFCIGRHLISLPVDFDQMLPVSATLKISNRPERETTIEVDVRQTDATATSFQKAVSQRQGEINASATNSTDVLKQVVRSERGDVLFRILMIRDSYSSELHLLIGTNYVTLDAKSYHAGFAEVEQKLFSYAKTLVASAAMKTSTPSGFCLGTAVLNGEHEGETATFLFRSTKRPAIAISVEIDTYTPDESPDLLGRVNGPNSLLKIFDVRNKVLRQGEVKVAGMNAQEWLSTVMLGENRDNKQASFVLETKRPHPGPEAPHIRVEMNVTGEEVIPSDKQLIDLWDLITKSVRLSGTSPI
jgi:hypothetical protein